MSKLNVNLVLGDGAVQPHRATDGSAGYDLACPGVYVIREGYQSVPLNFSMSFGDGWKAMVYGKSGNQCKGFKCDLHRFYTDGTDEVIKDVRIDAKVLTGTVDCDFRGVVGVLLFSTNRLLDVVPVPDGKMVSDWCLEIPAGAEIAQMEFEEYGVADIKVVDSLDDTERGSYGYGSGVKSKGKK